MTADRIARLREQITVQDHQVLRRLAQHRYLRTEQIARFEFMDRSTPLAGKRAAHRSLKRLRMLGLLLMLERTIGGPSRGSTAAVWTLTDTGLQVAEIDSNDRTAARRRFAEPTLMFLRHAIAVADLHLTLLDTERATDAELQHLETEPTCWRRYIGPLGSVMVLKPDLACDVETERFESRYFFEVDRSTEPPHRVIAKCHQYQEYYRFGTAQQDGPLPLVVWVVLSEARRTQLRRHLTTENGIDEPLYRIVLAHEIAALLGEDDSVGRLNGGPINEVERHG